MNNYEMSSLSDISFTAGYLREAAILYYWIVMFIWRNICKKII